MIFHYKELTVSQSTLGVSLRESRGPINTLMERLAGNDGQKWLRRLNQFNRGENPFEVPLVIEVVSDGRTGEGFISSLEAKKYNVSDYTKDVMRKPALVSTNGKKYGLIVVKGSEFDHDPTTQEIRDLAAECGYGTPAAECAPLLREVLSDDDLERMGVRWLTVMHEPITDSDGYPDLLLVGRSGGGRWLDTSWGDPDRQWSRGGGWVFLAPAE